MTICDWEGNRGTGRKKLQFFAKFMTKSCDSEVDHISNIAIWFLDSTKFVKRSTHKISVILSE